TTGARCVVLGDDEAVLPDERRQTGRTNPAFDGEIAGTEIEIRLVGRMANCVAASVQKCGRAAEHRLCGGDCGTIVGGPRLARLVSDRRAAVAAVEVQQRDDVGPMRVGGVADWGVQRLQRVRDQLHADAPKAENSTPATSAHTCSFWP